MGWVTSVSLDSLLVPREIANGIMHPPPSSPSLRRCRASQTSHQSNPVHLSCAQTTYGTRSIPLQTGQNRQNNYLLIYSPYSDLLIYHFLSSASIKPITSVLVFLRGVCVSVCVCVCVCVRRVCFEMNVHICFCKCLGLS